MSKDHQRKSQPLSFVKEGSADLEAQLLLEKRERARLDTDYKTKERLTLQEQLRLNAILKQEDFNALVKDRNSFNRLSVEDIEFYENLRKKAQSQKHNLEQSLEQQSRNFETRKKQAQESRSQSSATTMNTPSSDAAKRSQVPSRIVKPKSSTKTRLKGVIKKKHTESSKAAKKPT
ncbi:LAME_0H05864g1_1 [Lachancea meyersii CBS 8951]|uniref:LAME_0H05864g1_1 n=1 Tax=Lachancea meyersii CBS 8951 TaxID=1266667 RepID=A0A1G4KEG7_9SACH|nr:LAME_0H05864g1_1 [Lachancea meyersii CBS 8951]